MRRFPNKPDVWAGHGKRKPGRIIFVLVAFIAALWLIAPSLAQFAASPPMPEWIQSAENASNEPAIFRKTFRVEFPLLKAILLGACDGEMAVELNGAEVGRIAGRERATGLDVTANLRPGTNVLSIRARSGAEPRAAGSPRISVLLELNGDLARTTWIVSDSTWRTSAKETEAPVRSLGRVDADATANPFDAKKAFDAYNSWKLALGTNSATDPATFTLAPGFKAELLRSARPGEGSWVSMAFDLKGRLTLARESRGLIRLTLAQGHVEGVEVIDDTLLECRGLLYAYNALYVNANNSKGFFRLRDTDGDDRFDEVKCLLRTKGGVGHGRNHVVLGPDGAIYLVHGNNVNLAENVVPNSPLQNYKNDSLIPCPFDDAMFDGDAFLPAGHILRTDAEGTRFELVAGGFRNPLDIAFNRDGEMFTFDADMEWDVGSPWYRPNRVNHVLSGADFGWRRGTAKWPEYFPETLPATLNIGLASPTGIEFGTRSHFPPPYDEALFVSDWAYGRVLAVHLKPKGASYTATSELFVSGRPLNVTDVTFGPDGAMYLITGGRTTQSGLYRISYVGVQALAGGPDGLRTNNILPAKAGTPNLEGNAALARAVRRELESLHSPTNKLTPEKRLELAWAHLGDPDLAIRHAARVALEHVDVARWQSRALVERQIDVALTAWLALARFAKADAQEALLKHLNQLSLAELNASQQLQALRIYEVACSRMGKPESGTADTIRQRLEALYPAPDWRLNHRLCALLVYFESRSVISKTIGLLERTDTAEDLMQYLFYLRYVHNGWTLPQREAYFRAFQRAEQKQAARDYYSVLKRVRDDVVSSLTTNELQFVARSGLLDVAKSGSSTARTTSDLKFVRDWTVSDFDLAQRVGKRSLERGKTAFHAAQCVLCHRFGSEGGLIGPDLTSVASRFDRKAILESIIEPSKVIDEKYRNTIFTLSDGATVVGVTEREDEQKLFVREGFFAEGATEVARKNVVRREASPVSPMPTGLINVLEREQILDLLAYLQSGVVTNSTALRQ